LLLLSFFLCGFLVSFMKIVMNYVNRFEDATE
jgi:hypothetical protein